MEQLTLSPRHPVNPEEAGWISQVKHGNMQFFTFLVEGYQKPVYNMCYRMLSNHEDAEDAAQETFLRAYKSIQRYDSARPFSTWLLSIAAHYCIDQIRKRRMVLLSLEDTPELDLPDHSPAPEVIMSRKEDEVKVQRLLAAINGLDRAAVVFYYWYDLSYEEIAAALSLTVSAVKSRLHRARKELALAAIANPSPQRMVERIGYESPIV